MASRRRIDRVAVAQAGLSGAASRIRSLLSHDRERRDQLEETWPDLWDAIDDLVGCIDVIKPRHPDPVPGLFDGSFARIPKSE